MLKLSLAPFRCFCALFLLLLGPGLASAQTDFLTFESGQVRPLALSPDGTRLFAVNTPDNRLEVFNVVGGALVPALSIPVGMEPVAVAARTNTEVWVVNHLSDSVSIVDLAATPPRVVRTLLVGDEPRDILFAGTGGNRAFISTAHRGQHRTHSSISAVIGAGDPLLTTEDTGRADVWVFNAASLGTTIGGTPLRILTFFSDTPRALAKSLDGNTVFVAAFHSGNRTTSVLEQVVCDGFASPSGCLPGVPGGVVPPDDNDFGDAAPEVGIIIKFNGVSWRDSINRNWSPLVSFTLPDQDVFAVNANTFTAGNIFAGVGTILFNMIVNPSSGRLYVSNTELPNHVRFEGPGVHGGSTVQGHLSESRITVIDPAVPSSVNPKHLNKHIVYADLHTDVGANHAAIELQKLHSLATPTQMAIKIDGSKLYLAAFGSAKIGVFDPAEIEDVNFATNFSPAAESPNYIPTGGGPSGVVLDETNNRLYVLTRFDNSVRVINPDTKANLQTLALTNPEPAAVVAGRQFLYDANVSSGNGEAACASCHIFGDLDDLAWDLGNPDDAVGLVNNQPPATSLPVGNPFHPMKGPMTTQTLRGLSTHGGMHWRGDRVTGALGTDPCTDPSGSACNEDLSFRNFIVAFEGLLGKHGTITPAQMQQFTDFALELRLPPNPVRNLDNSLTTSQANGQTHYNGPVTDGLETCNGCHTLDPAQGFFGADGSQSDEGTPQHAKVPHLRNAYTKVGMFGVPGEAPHGAQIRGFGYLHDGAVDTLRRFVGAPVFSTTPTQEIELEQFMLAFPTDLAPVVGQQVTLSSTNGGEVNPRIDVFETRAGTAFASLILGGTVTECDVVVKGNVGLDPVGWRRESGTLPANTIYRDDTNQTITGANLRLLATSQGPLTYTCAPPGSGTRMGIDQDRDLAFDGLDNCATLANAGQQNFDADAQGDACDSDDDNDNLLDSVETGTGVYVSPTNTGSNPLDADSDDDARPDGLEVANGWDPNNPLSPGAPPVPALPFWGRLLLMAGVLLVGLYLLRGRGTPAPA